MRLQKKKSPTVKVGVKKRVKLMTNKEVKEEVSSINDFHFEDLAFARFRSRLEVGLSIREYFRLAGCWFSLPKEEARHLLRVFEQDYQVKKRYGPFGMELHVE
jgi:hypothetical protein